MEEHKNCCYEAGCFVTTHNDTIIAGSHSYRGLYYSEDKGKTWNQSNINFGGFGCLNVIGSTVIAGSKF